MSDLISREAAIEEVEFGITYVKAFNMETGEVRELFKASNKELQKAVERIKALPAAEVTLEQIEEYCRPRCLMLVTAEFFRAIRPTVEKKGKWIKGIGENGVNTSLYCDQCGYENRHWYKWNFCPNCGARMEET